MKPILPFFLLALLGTLACQQPAPQRQPLPELTAMLDSMAQIDQQVQTDFAKAIGTSSQDSMFQRQLNTFDRHGEILEELLDKHGFPGIDLVGETGTHHFWLMVQHCDRNVPFQEKVLSLMEKAWQEGNALGKDYAYLTDRVRQNKGQPMLFGTQIEYDSTGTAHARNLASADRVDSLRKSVGLAPLQVYLDQATEMHRRFNPHIYGQPADSSSSKFTVQ